MFTAHFDDSGTHDGSLNVTVGGFVADVEQWEHFEREWTEILAEFGLDKEPGYFRMADYESRQGAYSTWENSKRIEFMRKVTGVIRRRVNAGIAASFPSRNLDKMRAALPDTPLPDGYAYMTCAQVCWKNLGMWASEHHPDEKEIASVFEEGTTGQGIVLGAHKDMALNHPDIAEEFRLGGISFGLKKKVKPLQAADFFAYETYKRMIEHIQDRKRFRRSVELIVSSIPVYATFLEDGTTDEIVARLQKVRDPA